MIRLKSFILLSLIWFCFQCVSEKKSTIKDDPAITKIIKTRIFKAEKDFDKYVPGERESAFNLRIIAEELGLDVHWGKKYYDKFSNILYEEYFREAGNDETMIHTVNHFKYFSPSTGKLSQEFFYKNTIDDEFYLSSKTDFIRNDSGKLKEIITYNGSEEISSKKLFSYNDEGQVIKEELYYKNGLSSSISYIYKAKKVGQGKVLSKTTTNYNPFSKITEQYSWYNKENLKSKNRKYFKEGLKTNVTITFYDYINGIASKEVWEDNVNFGMNKGKYRKSTITRTFNDNFDIIAYSKNVDIFDEFGKSVIGNKHPILMDIHNRGNNKLYECQFIYNEKNEWIKLLVKDKVFGENYLILREINYK